MKRNIWNTSPLQITAHIGALIPLALILVDLITDNFGPDPIREMTLRTGKTALILLLLSLTATPIQRIFKYNPVLRLRRPLGLYAYLYVVLHFSIFLGVDYGFNLRLIQDALLEKRYALAGLSTGILLTPLAITSTKGWQRRLKKNWKRLHKFAYAAGILAVIHYIWLVKPGVSQPWIFAAILIFLFLLRIKSIQGWLKSAFSKIANLWAG